MPKEKVSLGRFNEMLAEKCKQFGVLARCDRKGDVSISGGQTAYHNAEARPKCQEECHNLLQAYEIDD
jgi:hypothetical protein